MATIKKTFEVEGMFCSSCAAGLQMFLSKTDGIKTATVDFDTKKGDIEYDDEEINEEKIVKGVGEVGYTLKPTD